METTPSATRCRVPPKCLWYWPGVARVWWCTRTTVLIHGVTVDFCHPAFWWIVTGLVVEIKKLKRPRAVIGICLLRDNEQSLRPSPQDGLTRLKQLFCVMGLHSHRKCTNVYHLGPYSSCCDDTQWNTEQLCLQAQQVRPVDPHVTFFARQNRYNFHEL